MKAVILASLLVAVASVAQADSTVKIGDACKIGAAGLQFGADVTGHMLKCNPRSLVYEEMSAPAKTDAVLGELVKLNATNQQILSQQIEANKIQRMILDELILAKKSK